jgi:hypothetical protein
VNSVVVSNFALADEYPTGYAMHTREMYLSAAPYEAVLSSAYVAFVVNKMEKNIVSDVDNDLVGKIMIERGSLRVERGHEKIADLSADDALQMVRHLRLTGNPRVMQSSDCIMTLEWYGEKEGVALIFAGDGMASISIRRSEGLYEDYGREVGVKESLPSEVVDVLARLSA